MDFNGAKIAGQFDQGNIIDELATVMREKAGGKITERQIALITDGFCYALSLEWLRLATAHKGPDNPGMEIILEGQNLPTLKDANSYAYFVQIANNFVTYIEAFEKKARKRTPEDFLSAPHKFKSWEEFDEFFLDVGTKGVIKPSGTVEHTAVSLPTLLNDTGIQYYFVGFDILDAKGNEDGGHQVAFCRHGGTLYFFDPNFGLYAVDNAANLLAALKRTYNTGTFYISYK